VKIFKNGTEMIELAQKIGQDL